MNFSDCETTIKKIINNFNLKATLVYKSMNENELFNGINTTNKDIFFITDEGCKYTNVHFFITDNNEKIYQQLVQYFPYKKESYVYVNLTENSKTIDDIYFVLLADNYVKNPKVASYELPIIYETFMHELLDNNMINNNALNIVKDLSYLFNTENKKDTMVTLNNIINRIYNIKTLKFTNTYDTTIINIINDEEHNKEYCECDESQNKEYCECDESEDVLDEYDEYNHNNTKLLRVFIKLSKLINNINNLKRRIEMFKLKNKLVNNKIGIKNAPDNLVKMLFY